MASRRHERWQACLRKRRYSNRRDAWRNVFDGMHVYRCPFTKGRRAHYHVGH